MLSNKGHTLQGLNRPFLTTCVNTFVINEKMNAVTTRRNNMFLLNNKSRVLKYKNDVLTVNPQMIEMVAQYAGCSVDEVIKALDTYFPDESPKQETTIQDLIARKVNKESTKQ